MLLDRLKNYNIILASQSPRRKELLTAMGVNFTLATPYEVSEVCPDIIPPDDMAVFLSIKKAEYYPYSLGDKDIIITADTLVIVDDKVLGKPKDRDEAIAYIKLLSGKSHRVITGVTLRHKEEYHIFSEETEVTFFELKSEDIIYYVDNYKPYDKAGAYGVQEWIGAIGIDSIDGTYFNIMGLPTALLYQELNNFINKLK